MKFGHKMTAVACAGALALMGVVPAFADVNADNGTSDVKISAAVAKDGEKIISVTVPSQMAIAITTDATANTFKSYKSADAEVKNNTVSNSNVKVTVDKVSQVAGVDKNGKLLDLVDLSLRGDADKTVILAEDTTNSLLFEKIAPDGSAKLKLEAAQKTANPAIPSDAYTVNATLKVTAVGA